MSYIRTIISLNFFSFTLAAWIWWCFRYFQQAIREGIPGVRDDRSWSRVAEWPLSYSMILVASSRLRSIYIIYRPAFPRRKDPEESIARAVRRVFTYVLTNVNEWLRDSCWSDCVREGVWDKLLTRHFTMYLIRNCFFSPFIILHFLKLVIFVNCSRS